MTAQRKVREDFNPAKEYRVDVSICSEEEKKEVQQGFFDAGIKWQIHGEEYNYMDADKYTNTTYCGEVTSYLMFGLTTKGCNMTAKEFLELVYEPEQDVFLAHTLRITDSSGNTIYDSTLAEKEKGHIHAESMAQYAEDAKTSETPWELWQMKSVDGVWRGCEAHPVWVSSTVYRRKPKTHVVNGVEIPDLRIDPKEGDRFYLVDPTEGDLTYRYTHTGDDCDEVWVSRRLCYEPTEAGREAAILHSKVMLGLVKE